MPTAQERANTVLSRLQDQLPLTFSGRGLTVTVTDMSVDSNGVLTVICSAVDSQGRSLRLDLPFLYVNPPTGVRLSNGTVRANAADTVQAAKDMLLDTVERFV